MNLFSEMCHGCNRRVSNEHTWVEVYVYIYIYIKKMVPFHSCLTAGSTSLFDLVLPLVQPLVRRPCSRLPGAGFVVCVFVCLVVCLSASSHLRRHVVIFAGICWRFCFLSVSPL